MSNIWHASVVNLKEVLRLCEHQECIKNRLKDFCARLEVDIRDTQQ